MHQLRGGLYQCLSDHQKSPAFIHRSIHTGFNAPDLADFYKHQEIQVNGRPTPIRSSHSRRQFVLIINH